MNGGIKLIRASALVEAVPAAGKRVLRGIASTVHEDRHGDVCLPRAAKYRLPLPLLWSHDHMSPVGKITAVQVTDDRIEITAEVATGIGKADETWRMCTEGLATGLSVGFLGNKYERRERGLLWTDWELAEVSIVVIPSNRQSLITSISGKSVPINSVAPVAAPRRGIPLVIARNNT